MPYIRPYISQISYWYTPDCFSLAHQICTTKITQMPTLSPTLMWLLRWIYCESQTHLLKSTRTTALILSEQVIFFARLENSCISGTCVSESQSFLANNTSHDISLLPGLSTLWGFGSQYIPRGCLLGSRLLQESGRRWASNWNHFGREKPLSNFILVVCWTHSILHCRSLLVSVRSEDSDQPVVYAKS